MAIVYQHRRADTGEVFYIGIGKFLKRAYSNKQRGKFWLDFTKSHIYIVEILLEDISWEHACYTEKYLIAFYGRRDLGLGPLVNLTDGGDGTKGIKKVVTDSFREKCRNRMKGKTWEEMYGIDQAKDFREKKRKESKDNAVLTKYVLEHGAPNKGKKMGPHSEVRNRNASISLKKMWSEKTLEDRYKHGNHLRTNNPTFHMVICEHCKKEIGKSHYRQWHGENCKSLKIKIK